jgi:hypothetical protein
LSNGDIAVVIENHPNYPLRPLIKIVKHRDPARTKIVHINLMEELGLVIEGVQYEVPEFPH